jgi:hypothetical protein
LSGISNHGSPEGFRETLADLLEAVTAESDDALPAFRRWCEAHICLIKAIAFGHDYVPAPLSDLLSFEEALVFVRMQLENLDAVRSATGLSQTGECRYEGLCAMEVDLIARISGQS